MASCFIVPADSVFDRHYLLFAGARVSVSTVGLLMLLWL